MENPNELVRRELIHNWASCNKPEVFLAEIDKTGGWPVGYKYVSFYHDAGDNRYCQFTNTSLRTGWWTTVCSADDYYWWKLSAERKADITTGIKKKLLSQITIEIANKVMASQRGEVEG